MKLFMTPGLNESNESPEQHDIAGWAGYTYQPGTDTIRSCYTKEIPPGQKRPPGADSVTSHPDPDKRASGWRLAWLFLIIVLIIACLAIGLA